MATAQEYAQWIVDNKDKKGTAEFETVAKAYQLAKQQPQTKSTGSDLAKGTASLVDTLYGIVPGVIGEAGYVGGRILGQTPQEAEQNVATVHKYMANPIGKATGITQDEGYTDPVKQFGEWLSPKISSAANTLSYIATGKRDAATDIEHGINIGSMLVGPKVAKGAGKVAAPVIEKGTQAVAPVVEGAGKVAKGTLDVAKAPVDFAKGALKVGGEDTLQPIGPKAFTKEGQQLYLEGKINKQQLEQYYSVPTEQVLQGPLANAARTITGDRISPRGEVAQGAGQRLREDIANKNPWTLAETGVNIMGHGLPIGSAIRRAPGMVSDYYLGRKLEVPGFKTKYDAEPSVAAQMRMNIERAEAQAAQQFPDPNVPNLYREQPIAPKMPNAIDSGFVNQLRNAHESFTEFSKKGADPATMISSRAKELQTHSQSQGMSQPFQSAKAQASKEYTDYNNKLIADQKAAEAKAKAEAQALKAQQEAEAKAAYEASPEGIAAKQAQEAHIKAVDDAIAKYHILQNDVAKNSGQRQKWIDNPESFNTRRGFAEWSANQKTEATAPQASKPNTADIIAQIRARKGETPSVPAEPAMNPVKPGKMSPDEILATIRARKGETPSVPANMPEPAPAPKQPSPALQKTREALTKQKPEEAPKGMAAFENMDDILLDSEKIGKSVAQQMAEDPKIQAWQNRSAAQRDRHSVTRDARDWVAVSKSKGQLSVNKDTLNEWATSQGIVLDWKTAPDIRKMKPNEAKGALSRWAQQQYKNFDPANPPAKELNPMERLFGE